VLASVALSVTVAIEIHKLVRRRWRVDRGHSGE